MRQNDIKALHDKTEAELHAMAAELQLELAKARLARDAGKLEDTASVKRISDDIARVKTVAREKELAGIAAKKAVALKTEESETEATEEKDEN